MIESFTASVLRAGFAAYSRCCGFRIQEVVAGDPRRKHDALVQKIFHQSGYLESPDTPLADDPEDSECYSFLVDHKRKTVGAVTTIKTEQKLPVEEFFNIRIPDDVNRGQIAELTRFVIERDYRRQDPVVSIMLLNAALRSSKRDGVRWWVWCAPSVFIWGFQSYFQNPRILEQHPLTESQIEMRKGREAYFSERNAIRVVLVDLNTISITRSAKEMWRRRRKRMGNAR